MLFGFSRDAASQLPKAFQNSACSMALLKCNQLKFIMDRTEQIKQYCQRFKITGISSNLETTIVEAEQKGLGFMEFTMSLFKTESDHRHRNEYHKRLKCAQLPKTHNLNTYDHTVENGLPKTRLNQLRELNWIDQGFNIMLMGPSGTGKTFIASGLCADAVEKGYKAYFRTMEDILNVLKLKDVVRSANSEYKRLIKANLIVIDDIMLFPVEKNQAVSLFNFVNQLYENTSFVITTNKAPADWAKLLDDEVLATALLDRILFHCELINLSGKSYRLKNRKPIFES
ncbi:MAG: IS21-like element helper ATPase IstB [Chryseolinea sp.]